MTYVGAGWYTPRCGCGKTEGHRLAPGSPCWPVPLAAVDPGSRVVYPDPDSPTARRVAAEWAHLEL